MNEKIIETDGKYQALPIQNDSVDDNEDKDDANEGISFEKINKTDYGKEESSYGVQRWS